MHSGLEWHPAVPLDWRAQEGEGQPGGGPPRFPPGCDPPMLRNLASPGDEMLELLTVYPLFTVNRQ